MKWTKKIAYSRKVAPYIFILPFVLSFLIFNLYPILSSLVMSFQKLKGFSSYQWVGFRNYKNLWNENFFAAVKTTTLVTAVECVVLTVLPMFLAVVLNNGLLKRKMYSAQFFSSQLWLQR